ncbi:MAG: hypothetical protein M1608_08785 [Candidatus Omnitrophica bacterium]|nr:hypothetical protein [Candidatus Omnitrophota bacterium]
MVSPYYSTGSVNGGCLANYLWNFGDWQGSRYPRRAGLMISPPTITVWGVSYGTGRSIGSG